MVLISASIVSSSEINPMLNFSDKIICDMEVFNSHFVEPFSVEFYENSCIYQIIDTSDLISVLKTIDHAAIMAAIKVALECDIGFNYRVAFDILKVRKNWRIDNYTFEDGKTLLMIACIKGNLKLVSLFLEMGANPDIRPYLHGLDSYCCALLHSHEDVALLLLDHCKNIESFPESRLILAVEKNLPRVVKRIIDRVIENEEIINNRSALDYIFGHLSSIISFSPSLSTRDIPNFLLLAINEGAIDSLNVLLLYTDYVNLSAPIFLEVAVRSGHLKILRQLLFSDLVPGLPREKSLEYKKQIKRYDSDRKALQLACSLNNCKIVQLLIIFGTNPNIVNPKSDEFDPMHLAIKSGREDLGLLLLSHGYDTQNIPQKYLKMAEEKMLFLLQDVIKNQNENINDITLKDLVENLV